jgi:hypothetical protein
MADLSATTKIETLIIPVYWAEFHIKKTGKEIPESLAQGLLTQRTGKNIFLF